MNPKERVCTTSAVLVISMLSALVGCASDPAANSVKHQAMATRPTESFRTHHAEIREHLDHIDAMTAGLDGRSPADQRETMDKVVAFLREHIGPHAADEERVLYPVVERHAGKGSRLTEVPVYEHRIVERSIAALEREATSEKPQGASFSREASHLVGLLHAHFEVEEEVLLPVLDKSMTPDQFRREVGDLMKH